MSHLDNTARTLGGHVASRALMQIVCPGPGHSARDRSLSVFIDPNSPDGFRVHPHAPGDDWRQARDYVKARLGIANHPHARRDHGGTSRRREVVDSSTPSDPDRTARALALWQESGKLDGSPGLTWLFRRGVNLGALPRDLHGALRWHPGCPWECARHGCMVGLFTDAATGEPRAIHRTAITPDGDKVGRKALGPIAGCVIRLWPDEDVLDGLVIGEGIETTLAAATCIEHRGTLLQPAWAAGFAGNMAKLAVLGGVEALTLLVDNDASGAGQRAAEECSAGGPLPVGRCTAWCRASPAPTSTTLWRRPMVEHPGTFDEFIDEPYQGNGKVSDGEAPRFKLIPFKNLTPRNVRRFLVKNMFPRVGLVLVWGPPKCGKSFWTFDAVMHIALGWEYRGLRIHQGLVVYCAFEGAEGFKARAEAFRQQHGLEGQAPPFHLVAAAMDLVRDQPELVASIKAQVGDDVPTVVVLDTLNRSLRGSESSDEDMAEYVRAADAIQAAFGCAVIVVHHCGHDGNRPRGHSALLGAVDAQIAVTRDTSDNIIATVERMKDGPEGATVASRLEQVDVGLDEDGDPITSCVVIPVDEGEIVKAAPTRKLSDRQRLALDCLGNLAVDGQPLPPEWQMPAGIMAVSIFTWRMEMEKRGVLDTEAANPRADFKRLKDSLQARQLIGERDGSVWKV